MANSIRPEDLGAAIQRELTLYHDDAVENVNAAGKAAVKDLVKKTRATAPKRTGSFRKNIASKKTATNPATGDETHTWYVKPPDHRITHLLVHGHAKANGGRVAGGPFLQNALDQVLPEYEKAVEEALKK